MKILIVNVVCGIRSTGRICTDLATALDAQGHEVKIAYGREDVPEQFKKYAVKIGSDFDVKLHGLKARLFDAVGFGSKLTTEKFIKWVEVYNPDIIHLHNIHGYYINIEILFSYLKVCGKRIIWTLHDCWSFTGHCTYFDYVGCDKWKFGCHDCPVKSEYPARIGPDRSKYNYQIKKKLFTGIANLTLVTPSIWLSKLLADSYMNGYPVQVIHNGVDTDIFRPIIDAVKYKSDLFDRKIILGVAAVWDRRKGLDVFVKLASYLDNSYQIILVGLNKGQIRDLPDNIIGIEKTNNVQELVELYSLASVFVNPTFEDNYPTTNIEAIACGTPVITFNTGGSPESAEMFGITVEKNDITQLVSAIEHIDRILPRDVDIDNKHTIHKYVELYLEG